ncbi:MAG TPA: FAD-binding oxidoreductase [Ktedonobacterales bacterium]|nr:FAD-binding oxidoreductase [Ktedonobacterales bacterium]
MTAAHSWRGSGDRVAIIGGGVTGALSAVRLAERGFRVTVLEKAHIGNGSSSRSAAGIRAQWSVAETIRGLRYAEWWYGQFHEALQTPPERRQPVIRRNGYLFLYEHPERAESERRAEVAAAWELGQANVARQRAAGVPVETLTSTEVARRWPWLTADRLIGAAWGPDDGFLHPHVIYGEGFRRARELGVEVWTETEALGAQAHGGRITTLHTTRGPLAVDWVVNATNAWAPRVSERLGGMALPISPVKRYLYHFEPTRPILSAEEWERLPMVIFGMGPGRGAHARPDGPLLLIGGASAAAPEPDFADADQDTIGDGFNHAVGIENAAYDLLAQLDDFSPALANCGGVKATTCGYYGMSPDGSPLIGRDTQLANLSHAVGFSGHGVMHAPVTALLVEALLAGDARDGAVPLPQGMGDIHLATYDPARDFSAARVESAVL